MITYLNINNYEQYQTLFREASEFLAGKENTEIYSELVDEASPSPADNFVYDLYYTKNDEEGYVYAGAYADGEDYYVLKNPITTLERYFDLLWALKQYKAPKKFFRLPLDEDMFLVDNNSRTIVVPSHFIKNGVAVQGDKYAETVYFKVHRFYDTVDLGLQEVTIQWIAQDGTKGVTTPDVEYQEDFLILKWPVSDVFTKSKGQLMFAIRFFKLDGEKIIYSLSTLPQTLNVKETLSFDLESIWDDENFIKEEPGDFQENLLISHPAD